MTFSALAGVFCLAWGTPSANNTAKVSARENRDRMRGAVYASPESFACVYSHAAIVFTIELRVCTTGRRYDDTTDDTMKASRRLAHTNPAKLTKRTKSGLNING